MTKAQAIDSFTASSTGWSDYWAMQADWSCYIDGLCSDNVITERQRCSWGNPTTPKGFSNWCKKHGI